MTGWQGKQQPTTLLQIDSNLQQPGWIRAPKEGEADLLRAIAPSPWAQDIARLRFSLTTRKYGLPLLTARWGFGGTTEERPVRHLTRHISNSQRRPHQPKCTHGTRKPIYNYTPLTW